MNPEIVRLPAIPLIASDPYLSIWMPADTLTQTDSCHWSGPRKPLLGESPWMAKPSAFWA